MIFLRNGVSVFRTCFLVLLMVVATHSWALSQALSQTLPVTFWDDYQAILDEAVEVGVYEGPHGDYQQNSVDYKKIKDDSGLHSRFEEQNQLLARLSQVVLDRFTDDEKLAFWINAYNYFTLYDVKNHYPIKSMKDLGWKSKRFLVAGKKYSLDDIEHGIIRGLNVPEIHFAVNCASVSCPTIAKTVFHPDTIRERLGELTKNAFKSPIHIQVGKRFLSNAKLISVTKLLKWYEKDFGRNEQEVLRFIHKYSPTAFKSINSYKASLNYDWGLNTKENIAGYVKELARE